MAKAGAIPALGRSSPTEPQKSPEQEIIPAICLNEATYMHNFSGIFKDHLSKNFAIKALPFCQRVNSPESESEVSLLLRDFSQ